MKAEKGNKTPQWKQWYLEMVEEWLYGSND